MVQGGGMKRSALAVMSATLLIAATSFGQVAREEPSAGSLQRENSPFSPDARPTLDRPSPLPSPSAPPIAVVTPAATPTLPPPTDRRSCAGSSGTPSVADPSSASRFPGVSASQFQRAGVGAEAFTRPGVSAQQLSALLPGARTNARTDPCVSPRDVVLYPEPMTQPRRIFSPTDEP